MPNTIYMFKIAGTGYPVVGNDYKVQNVEQYTAWTDANGKEHRSVYRTQMSGTFKMLFETIQAYNAFVADLASHKKNDTSVPCEAYDNISGQMVSADYYISFTPVRTLNDQWDDRVGMISVTIKER